MSFILFDVRIFLVHVGFVQLNSMMMNKFRLNVEKVLIHWKSQFCITSSSLLLLYPFPPTLIIIISPVIVLNRIIGFSETLEWRKTSISMQSSKYLAI